MASLSLVAHHLNLPLTYRTLMFWQRCAMFYWHRTKRRRICCQYYDYDYEHERCNDILSCKPWGDTQAMYSDA